MKKITLRQQFDAPLDQVFDVLSRHDTCNTLFWPIRSVRIQTATEGTNPDGVGSIREMGFGPVKPIREQITCVEPGRRIEYRMLKTPLFSDHRGEMLFSEKGGKTQLDYTIELEGRLPLLGPATLMQLKFAVSRGLKKLAQQLAA